MSGAKLTLKANFDEGTGSIGNLDAWRQHDALLRADLLQDWIHDLQKEYELAKALMCLPLDQQQEKQEELLENEHALN